MSNLYSEMPLIDLHNLPEDEKPHGDVVWYQLSNLASTTNQFDAALRLFDFCETQSLSSADLQLHGQWKLIACRDGALSLWNFHKSLTSIKQSLEKAKTLRGTIRMRSLDDALRELASVAPSIAEVRNSIAHSSELMQTPSAINLNATKGVRQEGYELDGSGFFISNLSGRTFLTGSHNGVVGSYKMSHETLDTLMKITRDVYALFSRD